MDFKLDTTVQGHLESSLREQIIRWLFSFFFLIQVPSLCLCNYAVVKQSIIVGSSTETSSWRQPKNATKMLGTMGRDAE